MFLKFIRHIVPTSMVQKVELEAQVEGAGSM